MTGYNYENYENAEDLPKRLTQIRHKVIDMLKDSDEDFLSSSAISQQVGKDDEVDLSPYSLRTILSELLRWMEEQKELKSKEEASGSYIDRKLWKLES